MLKQTAAYHFRGGIHPSGHKSLTADNAIQPLPLPSLLYLNLGMASQQPLVALVKPGDAVQQGQLVAQGTDPRSTPLHAPVNSIVEAIQPYHCPHPSGLKVPTLILRTQPDKAYTPHPAQNPYSLTVEQMIQGIAQAGIVGLGGAAFPTAIKLNGARQSGCHTLIINGGECEPFLTCDDRLMQEKPEDIIAGIQLLLTASGCKRAIIGIEDNKPAAFSALHYAANESEQIEVRQVPSLYPMGSEKHLIYTLTGQQVPQGQISLSIGILVQNVATAYAVYQALRYHQPLTHRIVTISGDSIERPGNYRVPIGTLVSHLISQAGGLKMDAARLIAGGPMMGQVLPSPFVPIDKSMGGILALSEQFVQSKNANGCIRCGRCVKACPMGLMPLEMASRARQHDLKGSVRFGLDNCLLCGSCSYECPAHIPLVQIFRYAKSSQQQERQGSQKTALAQTMKAQKETRLAIQQAQKAAKKASKSRKRPARAQVIQVQSEEEKS